MARAATRSRSRRGHTRSPPARATSSSARSPRRVSVRSNSTATADFTVAGGPAKLDVTVVPKQSPINVSDSPEQSGPAQTTVNVTVRNHGKGTAEGVSPQEPRHRVGRRRRQGAEAAARWRRSGRRRSPTWATSRPASPSPANSSSRRPGTGRTSSRPRRRARTSRARSRAPARRRSSRSRRCCSSIRGRSRASRARMRPS